MIDWLVRRLLRWLGAFDVTEADLAGIDSAIEDQARRMGLDTNGGTADGPA